MQQIEHFFAHYKDLEPGKWVRIIGWGGVDQAREIVISSIERARAEEAEPRPAGGEAL
jgi:inorganic pyrophosphatase